MTDEELGEYGGYVLASSRSGERSGGGTSIQEITCWNKWRQAPRNPSYFSDCRTSVSSCNDSDYEAWLTNYYNELHREANRKVVFDKVTNTFDLGEGDAPRKNSAALSAFASTMQKESTKYWGVKDIRRHWPLTKNSREYQLFPSIHPLLDLTTRYGRYFSYLHSTSAEPETEHRKRACAMFKLNLVRAKLFSFQLAVLTLCDNLISFSWYDVVTKKTIITAMCQLLKAQKHLEIVSFENAGLHQIEGTVLLCALSRDGGENVKELHIWRMFGYGQCPVLKDKYSMEATSKSNRTRHIDLKYHFMDILNNFSNLTHLSVNYAYLANRCGDALLCLRTIRYGRLQELRLLCLPEERPLLTNPGYGVGGYKIPDGVWRRAREWNPRMRAMFVFINLPQYENIILFLSKNIPLSTFYVSSGVDFKSNAPWEVDSTLLELRNWYSTTLETLSLHLWHHRDLLDYVIEYRILDEFPNLVTFEFIGALKCIKTLEGFCRRLLTKKYKLKTLLFWVQEIYSNRSKRKEMLESVLEIKKTYLKQLQNSAIDADIRIYPI